MRSPRSAGSRRPRRPRTANACARYAQSVARELGLIEPDDDTLAIAAQFHDVGKAAMPEALLSKPSPLTLGEIAVMQLHVEMGVQILDSTPSLAHAAAIVRASHEWFGGGGYPSRLSGDAIPIASRIIAVVDAYDAMTQDRGYRSRLDTPDAIRELLRCCPAQFDPEVVTAFLEDPRPPLIATYAPILGPVRPTTGQFFRPAHCFCPVINT